jgi:hypothetical protein
MLLADRRRLVLHEILGGTGIPLELIVPLSLNAMDKHHTSRSVD